MNHTPITGRTVAGTWWVSCTHPSCDYYASGARTREAAEDRGYEHQEQAERRRNGVASAR